MNGKSDAGNHETSNRVADNPTTTPGSQESTNFETNNFANSNQLQRAVLNPRTASPATILQLQRLYGNKAVTKVIQRAFTSQPTTAQIQRILSKTDIRKLYDKYVTKRGLDTKTFSSVVKSNSGSTSDQVEVLLQNALTTQNAPVAPVVAPVMVAQDQAQPQDLAQPIPQPDVAQPQATISDDVIAEMLQSEESSAAVSAVDENPIKKAEDIKTVADIDQTELTAIEGINAKSQEPYRILHDVLHQSWNYAKHELAIPPSGTQVQKRQAVMQKLWDYRQWHHDLVLHAVQDEMNNNPSTAGGLTKWASAGSTTLTSDIDVNLKGPNTELATKLFNQKFKTGVPEGHVWNYEPGVVYDVNVYALDFMHGVDESTDRALVEGGGISGSEKQKEDSLDQNIWSLVKLRLYTTSSAWESYVKTINASPTIAAEARKRYLGYESTLLAEMVGEQPLPAIENKDSLTGVGYIDEVAHHLVPEQASKADQEVGAENNKMRASNRIYEGKVAEIYTLRQELKQLKSRADAVREELKTLKQPMQLPGSPAQVQAQNSPAQASVAQARAIREQDLQEELNELQTELDELLVGLRSKISEAALFSNEAYITGGAVSHTVVGTQIGTKLQQNRQEVMQAVNENVADALKEIARHGESLGAAAYKAGKYIMRLGDAARNLGLRSIGEGNADQTNMPGMDTTVFNTFIAPLYKAGYEIAINIKGAGTPKENEDKAAEVAKKYLGTLGVVDEATQLSHVVMTAGEIIAQTFNSLENSDKNSDALKMKGKQDKKLVENTNQ